MVNFIKTYVRLVDKMNYLIGRVTMFTIFVMVGVLFYSAITKTFFTPSLWTYEFAQFIIGGILFNRRCLFDPVAWSRPYGSALRWMERAHSKPLGFSNIIDYDSIFNFATIWRH